MKNKKEKTALSGALLKTNEASLMRAAPLIKTAKRIGGAGLCFDSGKLKTLYRY